MGLWNCFLHPTIHPIYPTRHFVYFSNRIWSHTCILLQSPDCRDYCCIHPQPTCSPLFTFEKRSGYTDESVLELAMQPRLASTHVTTMPGKSIVLKNFSGYRVLEAGEKMKTAAQTALEVKAVYCQALWIDCDPRTYRVEGQNYNLKLPLSGRTR